ncbi:MAG: hypothetical protein ACP5UU_06135, partial [Thermoprotei archaeon]
EAVNYLYDKVFGQHKKKPRKLTKVHILILILVVISPLLYLLGSALAPTASATLIYEGNWSEVSGLGLLGKNWFFKGENASLQFLVRNAYYRQLDFSVYVQAYGGGPRAEVAGFSVPGGLSPVTKRVNVTVQTGDLNDSLYEVELVAEGTGLTLTRDPSSQWNFLTYPWLIAVMQPLPYLPPNESEAHGIPPLVVPYGLGINIHFVVPSQSELLTLGMLKQA